MSRVITFSRVFPSYHPKAGQPTYFVEKIWSSLEINIVGVDVFQFIAQHNHKLGSDVINPFVRSLTTGDYTPKHHTIRAGHRFKEGDWFSPRVWSGKPYNSKMITIAPDIQIKKVWDFEMYWGIHKRFGPYQEVRVNSVTMSVDEIAKNDGLEVGDFLSWFNKPMTGQIICWSDSIEY